MKIFNGNQIKSWDKFTIENEPITSTALMERASSAFVDKFVTTYPDRSRPINIFCGNGNNGGDGLVIGRLLMFNMYEVVIYKIQLTPKDSEDFDVQWQKNLAYDALKMIPLNNNNSIPTLSGMVIDAILGTGFSRPLSEELALIIMSINSSGLPIVSVDIPSGLPSDDIANSVAIQATQTFTFQIPKYSFFLKKNFQFVPQWTVIDIGLSKNFIDSEGCPRMYLTKDIVQSFYRKRHKFGHKGDYGTAHLLVGSKNMMGAAILASNAAIKSGAGIVKTIVPKSLQIPIMASIPEVMALGRKSIRNIDFNTKNNTLGLGSGLGIHKQSIKVLEYILNHVHTPLVIDADGINIIAQEKWHNRIPAGSIITPHLKEFSRMWGDTKNSLECYQLASEMSMVHQIIIVLKGAHTHIFLPNGEIYINSTGNVGMATAGSGDVLTGLITGLLAQGYTPKEAALLGVYLHGLAGDFALLNESEETLTALNIINGLAQAFKTLY